MPLGECIRIHASSPEIYLKIYKGHFATSHSHMNYYIDIASNKASMREARAIAYDLAQTVKYTSHVDTILCLDGTEVIGAFLARALSKQDRFNVNGGRDVYILTPEHSDGQLLFRDNTAPMIAGKDVLILAASVVTGCTAEGAVEAVRYYGGNPVEICSIFATLTSLEELPVRSVFDPSDLPGYFYAPAHSCPMCKQGERITALVNSFGCSAL